MSGSGSPRGDGPRARGPAGGVGRAGDAGAGQASEWHAAAARVLQQLARQGPRRNLPPYAPSLPTLREIQQGSLEAPWSLGVLGNASQAMPHAVTLGGGHRAARAHHGPSTSASQDMAHAAAHAQPGAHAHASTDEARSRHEAAAFALAHPAASAQAGAHPAANAQAGAHARASTHAASSQPLGHARSGQPPQHGDSFPGGLAFGFGSVVSLDLPGLRRWGLAQGVAAPTVTHNGRDQGLAELLRCGLATRSVLMSCERAVTCVSLACLFLERVCVWCICLSLSRVCL